MMSWVAVMLAAILPLETADADRPEQDDTAIVAAADTETLHPHWAARSSSR